LFYDALNNFDHTASKVMIGEEFGRNQSWHGRGAVTEFDGF